MLRKILIALDGSEPSLEALPVVQRFVEGTVAEITLFTAAQPPRATTTRQRKGPLQPVPVPSMPGSPVRGVIAPEPPAYAENRDQAIERREHELLEYLADVARPLLQAGQRVELAVHFGEPVTEITGLARRGGFDLIVMATHARSGLGKALHESVVAGVIGSGVAPVLVVRPSSGGR